MEVWKDIKGYEGLYQVSNLGRVKNLSRSVKNRYSYKNIPEKVLKFIEKKGYLYVALCVDNERHFFRVHRLVAETFIPDKNNFKYIDEEDRIKYLNNLEKLEINHIDKNRSNNNVGNLEYCTRKYNVNY